MNSPGFSWKSFVIIFFKRPFSMWGFFLLWCYLIGVFSHQFSFSDNLVQWLFTILWLVLGVLYTLLKNKVITSVGYYQNDILLFVHGYPKWTLVESGNSFLGTEWMGSLENGLKTQKSLILRVTLPELDQENEKSYFSVATSIECDYERFVVDIPIRLVVELSSARYDANELYARVVSDMDCRHVGEFVIKTFQTNIASNGNIEKINALALEYVDGCMSKEKLVKKIAHLLSFPKNILSNFKEVKFVVDYPRVTVCSEHSCGISS